MKKKERISLRGYRALEKSKVWGAVGGTAEPKVSKGYSYTSPSDLQGTIRQLATEKERLEAEVQELRRRAESFKAQLIVYKGLYEKVMDKLISRCNE